MKVPEVLINKIRTKQNEFEAKHKHKPLYVILSDDDAEELEAWIRHENQYAPGTIVTKYGDMSISRNMSMQPGEVMLSDELPHLSG